MKRITAVFLCVLIVTVFSAPATVLGADEGGAVSIAFTNDIHSHLDSANGKGGLAKVKTLIDDVEKDNEDTFLLDGGGFSMGTPFQTIYTTNASELRMLGSLGYDAVGLGNSEFDYGADGLAKMLNRAAQEKETKKTTSTKYNTQTYITETTTTFTKTMPEVVCSNLNWQKTKSKALRNAWANYGVSDYTVIEKNGVKMAVFGLMGEKSTGETANSGAVWQDSADRAKEVVKEIKNNEDADMIVCLSSGGEDEDLAKDVPEINLIISSGEGREIKEPVTEGDTVIVGTAGNTEQLGHLVLKKNGDKYTVKSYDLKNTGSGVAKDTDTASLVSEFKSAVNSGYMNKYGYSYDEGLATAKSGINDAGDLVSDSFIKAVKKAEGSRYETVDAAIVSADSLDAGIKKGTVTAADAYDVCGIGMGDDGSSGYPLVTCYLTGKEIKKLAEINVSLSDDNDSAKLWMSGVSYSYNDHRLKLNRAYDIKLDRGNGKYEKINNGQLYRVVTGLAEIRNVSLLDGIAAGMMKITPKDKKGNEVTDYSKLILKRGGREVKEWQALAGYVDSSKNNVIPASYSVSDDRAADRTGFNPIDLFKQPNNIGMILWAIVLIVIVIIIGILLFLRQRKHARRGFGRRVFKQKKRKSGKPLFKQHKFKMRR
ncbi:MAG: 5'-nucleotidase C-terminal domain-containing protein [Eubacteriaceae bacterium]|nr:5'-nucleotidase C-terminal domain-containing protein [Eubacteriaceae bacterium]